MQRYFLFVDGERREPDSRQWFNSDNPFTRQPWAEIARGNEVDADLAVRAAHRTISWAYFVAAKP